jgi:RNA polymerase sigma-70 factor (ECF subfamily)
VDLQEIRIQLEVLHPECFAWAVCCCRWDREEAEEVLQMAYLNVLNGRASFAARSSFKTWLFGVIRYTALDQRRRGLRRMRILRDWLVRNPPDRPVLADPAATLTLTETATRLRAELRRLPRRQREVLHLVFYQDLTIEEAAGVLEVALGTARTHYERGKRRLRERLGEERDA